MHRSVRAGGEGLQASIPFHFFATYEWVDLVGILFVCFGQLPRSSMHLKLQGRCGLSGFGVQKSYLEIRVNSSSAGPDAKVAFCYVENWFKRRSRPLPTTLSATPNLSCDQPGTHSQQRVALHMLERSIGQHSDRWGFATRLKE